MKARISFNPKFKGKTLNLIGQQCCFPVVADGTPLLIPSYHHHLLLHLPLPQQKSDGWPSWRWVG